MFTSISRGRAKLRPTYICTSCLAHILPPPGPQSARQVQNRESFSTIPNHGQADKKNESDEEFSKGRRRGRTAAPISHSKDALAALKESLQAEETASKASKSKSKPKKKIAEPAETTIELAKEGKALSGLKKKPKRVPKTGPVETTKERAEIGEPSPVSKEKSKVGKTEPTKSKKTANTKKTSPKASEAAALADKTLAKKPTSSKISRPSKKTKAKLPTDAQRQKIDAVLLGARNKRAAVLGKKIKSHIHAIGENETRQALVKIIEDGKLSKDVIAALKGVRKSRSRLRKKPLTIKRIMSTKDSRPLVRKLVSKSSEEDVRLLGYKTIEEALQGRHFKRSAAVARRSRIARPPPRRIKSKPGENVVTGPLEEREGFEIKTLDASDLELTPINKPQPAVPNLWYGLDRVLFNPGVYQLQDPRSRVFNFDPYLQTIMPVSEFDFTALKKYITSSRDETLLATAREEKKKYTGSTSSTTAALAHFHFLLSQWRPVNTGLLSQDFPVEYNTFTSLQRGPCAIFLRWKDGVYAIDADKQFDTANILSTLGKSMEKFLTLPTEDFEKYRRQNSDQIPIEQREAAEAFHYTTMGDFLLRSQLDAHDPRLPGTGMFDLKTRAVVSIRMDTSEYEQGMDYEIRQRYGEWESYEREYYDMIRAAFLKYSLQVRMGRMDGIFVAFHNTQRIFGFQYISLPELDLALHGTEDTTIGDSEFKMSLELFNKVLDRATAKYPEKSLRLHFETRGTDVPFMYIFAEPMEDEQIKEIQESNKEVIEEFEKRVLGLESEEPEEEAEPELSEEDKKAAEWATMRAKVEENMEKDELDIEEARAIADSMIDDSDIFGSEEISAEEKERLINDLLESSAFSEEEEEQAAVSRSDGDPEEDDVESASANSENEDTDEDGENGEDEEDEVNEEDEEEQEEEDGKQEEMGEEGQEVDDPESLEQADGKDLFDESPINRITGEPEVEVSQTETDPEFAEFVDQVQDNTNTDADDITDTDSIHPEESELVENKDLALNDAALNSDTGDSAASEESSTSIDGEAETYKPVSDDIQKSAEEGEFQDPTEVLAMTLTIRNKVNGHYVDRPKKLTSKDKWTIEYALEDVPTTHKASRLYQACKRRRARALSSAKRDDDNPWNNRYLQNLRELSKKGKEWREEQNMLDSQEPVKVLDWDVIKDQADQTPWAKKEESPGENVDEKKQ